MAHNHHHDHHGHGAGWNVSRVVAAAALLAAARLVERGACLATWQLLLVYLVPYLTVGAGTLRETAEGLAHGDVFNENALMCLATVGALAIGFLPGARAEFAEAVFVMLFFRVGGLFEGYAQDRSRQGISKLLDIRPDVATVVRGGEELVAEAAGVAVGETIVVRPGERVALDGVVSRGHSTLDMAALTGESVPVSVGRGDDILSGSVNLSGVVWVRVRKPFGESTASKIIAMVEDAAQSKSRSEAFITRFARRYTPAVFFLAVFLAVVPPVALPGDYMRLFPKWLYRALMFLVVSCPCALVISVPLTFFGGIGGASRKGILVKGGNFLEALARAATAVFDKTGTLTRGVFAVREVNALGMDGDGLLRLAALAERYSTHPVAAALRAACDRDALASGSVASVCEVAGQGVVATVDGRRVAVGSSRLMEARGVRWSLNAMAEGTVAHVAVDDAYAGYIVISDTVKPAAADAMDMLRRMGVRRIVMLTGDGDTAAATVARELGIAEYGAGLLPDGKRERVERLLGERRRGDSLIFVGDGMNDAPVLARADVGVAMGAMGSDAAIEAADVVIMDDDPRRVATAIAIARRTVAIARQNVWLALGVKAAVMLLAVSGMGTLGMAVFADVGVMVLAVMNAMRALSSGR